MNSLKLKTSHANLSGYDPATRGTTIARAARSQSGLGAVQSTARGSDGGDELVPAHLRNIRRSGNPVIPAWRYHVSTAAAVQRRPIVDQGSARLEECGATELLTRSTRR